MRKIILAICCSIMLAACGPSKHIKMVEDTAQMQKPILLTKTGSDKRPGWCTKGTYWEKDGNMYYSGGYMGGTDYSLSIRLAKSEATKNLIESASIKAREEFSHSMQGSNMSPEDVGRCVTDTVGWTVENLRVSGIKQRKIYYEEVFNPSSMEPAYNAWVLLEIPRSEYLKAKVSAANRLLQKAIEENNLEAKEKAEEMLQKLQEEI